MRDDDRDQQDCNDRVEPVRPLHADDPGEGEGGHQEEAADRQGQAEEDNAPEDQLLAGVETSGLGVEGGVLAEHAASLPKPFPVGSFRQVIMHPQEKYQDYPDRERRA